MIPKIIHYCWFGHNPMPEMSLRCIDSWKKFFPEYEIKEWNEENFDVNIIPYTAEAYKAKKYAFVSDYARFWILYKYGGLYFDTDVEVIRPMDDIIAKGAFMGCENFADKNSIKVTIGVAPGLGLGVKQGHDLYKEILNHYSESSFSLSDGSIDATTVVDRTTSILSNYGLKNISQIQQIRGIYIYPKDYFCPKDYFTGKLEITENTRCIHHYSSSWLPWYMNFENKFWHFFGLKNMDLITEIRKIIKKQNK